MTAKITDALESWAVVPRRKSAGCVAVLAFVFLFTPGSAHAQQLEPNRQLPADQRAYRAAMSLTDPAQRLTALRTFSVQYQDSKYFDSVQEAALRLLLQSFPTRIAEIRDQVQVNIANADKGYERWREQSTEADLLADAGVQLLLAQKLAEDSSRSLTEATFLRGMARMFGELQSEMPTPEELHGQYTEARASTLLALAHVYLRQGKAAQATVLLDQASTLQPRSAQAHALRGELLLAAHHNDAALQELEQAQALGELSATQRENLVKLFREVGGGSDEGLEAELDRRYLEANPPPFMPPSRKPVTAGHTALLELFTGSSCLPCVGADLAVDALLTAYHRDELVVLEWDEHVPRPDPLANPASVARAEVLGVGNTPAYFLDGRRMAVYGGTRDGAAEVYTGLTRLVDTQVKRSSGVALSVTATQDAGGHVRVAAETKTAEEIHLRQVTADESAPWPGDSIAVAERAHTDAAFPPQLVINFALVEDNVRYSGENGVRFHQAVVRATASEPAFGLLLHPGRTENFQPAFDLAVTKQSLTEYLRHFEGSNEQFGPVRFLSQEVSLTPARLGVVAWVQDTRTHRVVQAASVPVSSARELRP